jgi:hypothetical protein
MPSKKKRHVKLTKGVVLSAIVGPEEVTGVVTKLMKVVAIERKPGQKIAWIELKVEQGEFDIRIDEATVQAMSAVFDEPSQPPVEEVMAELDES